MIAGKPTQRTLLLIDDNVTNLRVAIDLLKAYSYKILTASNGQDGLERAQLARPDLILLDIRMSGIDGLETCRRLKANPETLAIPVIFMTAIDETRQIVRGLEAGAVDYITKPFEAAELLARVQTHLNLRDLQANLEQRVAERTAALAEEIEHRKRSQAEQELLLELVREQSDHLRQFVERSIDDQQQRDHGLVETLHTRVEREIEIVETCLHQAQRLLTQFTESTPSVRIAGDQIGHALSILGRILQQTQSITTDLDQGAPAHQQTRNNPLFKLTTREYEVLQLIVQGKSNSEIADLLVVNRGTISTYRKRIMDKLEVHDTPTLIKFVLEQR